MKKRSSTRRRDRKAIAAVEAAVCLPVLVIIWLGTVEVSRLLSLKQQGQLIASTAAHRIVESTTSFSAIETEMESLASSIGIEGFQIELARIDSEVIESAVTIDSSANSPFGSILGSHDVTSKYYSYRED